MFESAFTIVGTVIAVVVVLLLLWIAVGCLLALVGAIVEHPLFFAVLAAIAAMLVISALKVNAEQPTKTEAPTGRGVMILPPLEYDYPYQGKLTIERVNTVAELQDVCGVTKWLLGCSWRRADSCRIVLVADDVIRRWGWTPELMLRHEHGHCNGWPGDHPGQRDYREPAGKAPPKPEPSREPATVINPVYKVYPKSGKDESRVPAQ